MPIQLYHVQPIHRSRDPVPLTNSEQKRKADLQKNIFISDHRSAFVIRLQIIEVDGGVEFCRRDFARFQLLEHFVLCLKIVFLLLLVVVFAASWRLRCGSALFCSPLFLITPLIQNLVFLGPGLKLDKLLYYHTLAFY